MSRVVNYYMDIPALFITVARAAAGACDTLACSSDASSSSLEGFLAACSLRATASAAVHSSCFTTVRSVLASDLELLLDDAGDTGEARNECQWEKSAELTLAMQLDEYVRMATCAARRAFSAST